MFTKKYKYSFQSTISVILLIAILLMVNFLGTRYFARYDMTEDKQYTVADSTKAALANLDDIVTVKVFFTTGLPSHMVPITQAVRDMLNEFSAYAKGNVRLDYADPSADRETRQEALSIGIPEIQMNVLEKDALSVKKGFLGIAVYFADRVEVLPVVQSTRNLEYDLLSAIKKVSSPELPVVAMLTGHGVNGGSYTDLAQELMRNYELREVAISNRAALDDVDTLLLPLIDEPLTDQEQFVIEQFVLRGGKLIVMADTLKMAESGVAFMPVDNGVNRMLGPWGITVNQDLVGDGPRETVSFTQGQITFMIPYVLWPKLIVENFAQDNPIMQKIEAVVMPWASSLTIAPVEGITHEILATTTSKAVSVGEPWNADPNAIYDLSEKEPLPMLVLARGTFTGSFTDETVPFEAAATEDTDEPAATEAPEDPAVDAVAEESPQPLLTASTVESFVMVVGDSEFVSNQIARKFPNNMIFMLNAIDYLTIGDDLINIRSRVVYDRPLDEVSEGTKGMIKVIGILGGTVILIIYGVVRVLIRRRRKKFLNLF